ncbi:hypothetical protein [Hyphomicrobium sp.]|uniref:hypothetical protein n=1 Tax=Hyphomicrobium sp. TaxID=82 RepID=UPI0025C6599F|nr:hypothetical protein [Hyphomicrobium sp.]MCC7253721.1 hypothetical protein [Hyphomicrobium sp.]
MTPWIRAAACIVLAAACVLSSQAQADGDAPPAPSQAAREAPPLKDCTRLNGRIGYYGNPWCTPAEQARWDRWEARRFGAK